MLLRVPSSTLRHRKSHFLKFPLRARHQNLLQQCTLNKFYLMEEISLYCCHLINEATCEEYRCHDTLFCHQIECLCKSRKELIWSHPQHQSTALQSSLFSSTCAKLTSKFSFIFSVRTLFAPRAHSQCATEKGSMASTNKIIAKHWRH